MPLSIIHYPHPTLRHRSLPIVRVDKKLREIAAEMLDRMYEFEGVGLAANQVDLPIRLFVANPTGVRGDGEEFVFVNPEIDRPKGNESSREGCLSVPGLYGEVKRPKSIRFQAYDLSGKEVTMNVDGFLSRVFQHEFDHLNGVMFFDRMSEESRRELLGGLEEFDTVYRSKRGTGEIPGDDVLAQQRTRWESIYTTANVS